MSLRERTRRAVRAELVDAAMELFLTQGYDDTTVEQIATAAGMSRRSYFRYFASKDEVFAEGLASIGQLVAATLASRPADEAPWVALRRAFDPVLARIEGDDRAPAMARMLLDSPMMQGTHQKKQTGWQASLADVLEPRLRAGGPEPRLRAEALAGAALACLNSAQKGWLLAANEMALGDLLDIAMSAVRPPPR